MFYTWFAVFWTCLQLNFVDLVINCETQDLEQCFLPSSAQFAFLHGMISSICCRCTRPKDLFLRTFYDLGFLAISPLLPICFQIRLAGLTPRISKLKDQFETDKNIGEIFLKKFPFHWSWIGERCKKKTRKENKQVLVLPLHIHTPL